MRLYVYNHEYNVTRTVTITPSRGWGGQGALGCVLGFGALHRIPPPLDEPPQAPGETLFEKLSFDDTRPISSSTTTVDGSAKPEQPFTPVGDFLVPADMNIGRPPSGGPLASGPPKGRKQRAHHAISPGASMDDYFKAGEEKSRAQDVGTNSKSGTALPPPPKAGGPPRGPSPLKEAEPSDA